MQDPVKIWNTRPTDRCHQKNVLQLLHTNVSRKRKRKVEYGASVQQGDSMVPPLFLLVMQGAIETFKKLTTQPKLERYHPFTQTPTKQKERFQGQETKWEGKKCLINNLLYVDDGVFAYSSKQEIEKGTQQLHNHLAKFRLQMHVGSENMKSKTEAMFILTEDV